MGQYSSEEVKAFDKKDLRINRVAILKSLLESGRNNEEQIKENCEMANAYVEFVYNGLPDVGVDIGQSVKVLVVPDTVECTIDWKVVATDNKLAVPENIKVLDRLWDEYKKEYGVGSNPAKLLSDVYGAYHKYPTKMDSIETVLTKIRRQ
ncbi:MAG: hypothetical protein IMZ70_08410 [Candidatus Atribacteria bacterium]|nr:hypothetical protein [Candidatus Atribacteria bacterium]